MTSVTIRIEGIEQLLATLDGTKILHTTMSMAGQTIAGHMRDAYPPSPAGRHQPFVSDKQRRGFFAKLKAGLIDVPYQRGKSGASEDMQSKWTVENESDTKVVVGNNTSYGPLVMGDRQTHFHQETGWKTIQTIATEKAPSVEEEIRKAIDNYFKGVA